MFLEIILFLIFGTVLGIVAGLVPGLHPNTVLIVMLSLSWVLGKHDPYSVLTLITSMAVVNTIVNFIPSIFLGAPDPDNCLVVLPGHRFLMEGRGYEALFLTVIGGAGVLMFTTLALPFLLWFIPFIYGRIHTYMHILLLAVLALLVYHERGKKRAYAVLMFFASGLAGTMLLSVLPSERALFPALSGLFGISVIIIGAMQKTTLPKQKACVKKEVKWLKGCIAGWLAGMFVGTLPGIGSSQAGVLASKALRGRDRDFMVALGGINTANIIFTFIALHVIGKTRSGAAWAVSEILGKITTDDIYLTIIVALLSCFVSSVITLKIGKRALNIMEKTDYRRLNLAVLGSLVLIISLFSGFEGMIIAALSTALGLACAGMGVKRMYLMGFLMFPTILHFAGLSSNALVLLGL